MKQKAEKGHGNAGSSKTSCTVVYASDGNDVELLKASIFSIRKFLGTPEIYVLSDTLSEDDVKGVKIVDPTPILESLGFYSDGWNRKWPFATLYRLAIPLVEELQDKETVLYLDTDVLARKPDALEIFSNVDGTHEITGSVDTNGKWDRIDKCVRCDLKLDATVSIIQRLWSSREIEGRTYINAGVLLWHVSNIKKNGLDWYRQRLKWFWNAETRGKFTYLDQDFVNSMMDVGDPIDREFNWFAEYKGSDADAIFKHYVGSFKGMMTREAAAMGYVADDDLIDRTIIYATDGASDDVKRLEMSMASARKHIGQGTKFIVLTENNEIKQLSGKENVTLVNPLQALKSVGVFKEGWNRKWPFAVMYRLAIPLLPELEGVGSALYLDTDTLVRSSKAKKLFSMKSNGYEVFGAQDCEARQTIIEGSISNDLPNDAKRQMKKKLWDVRAKFTSGYINAGVLVLMLDEIRNNGLDWYRQRMKWFWAGVTKGKFKFLDQDFINVMMDVSPSLSVRYNRFGGDFGTNCVIQHFVAGAKGAMDGVARSMGI